MLHQEINPTDQVKFDSLEALVAPGACAFQHQLFLLRSLIVHYCGLTTALRSVALVKSTVAALPNNVGSTCRGGALQAPWCLLHHRCTIAAELQLIL
jgi:hypothetical protein